MLGQVVKWIGTFCFGFICTSKVEVNGTVLRFSSPLLYFFLGSYSLSKILLRLVRLLKKCVDLTTL